MQVENNPDFKSVWQLAHDWAGVQLEQADSVMITEEARLAIDRLIRAISNKEISGRWKGYRIFMDDSFLSSIFEIRHIARFFLWFRFNKSTGIISITSM